MAPEPWAWHPTTHKIYLPCAEFETGANGRRAPKPGTFMILVGRSPYRQVAQYAVAVRRAVPRQPR